MSKEQLTPDEFLDSKNITEQSTVWFTSDSEGTADVEGYNLPELLKDYQLTQQKEDQKKMCCDFFRWWWNQPGTNTEQGFDKWHKQQS